MSEKQTYPLLEVHLDRIESNARAVTDYCRQRGIAVAGVTKFSDGDIKIARAYRRGGCAQIACSRLPHLRAVKEDMPDTPTLLLRLPGPSEVEDTVRWCDISLNSQRQTLRLLNGAALAQDKCHGVLLMLDVGDLREGVPTAEELFELALWVERELPGLYLAGVGSSFTCFGSIIATAENLGVLVAAAGRIEAAIGRKLDIISGGSSSSVVALTNGEMPPEINHLRFGAAICNPRSTRIVRNVVLPGVREDTFTLQAEIIEVFTKPSKPYGKSSYNWSGKEVEFADRGIRRRAIAALGSQDIGDATRLVPRDEGVQVLGGSSDHTILDIQDSPRDWQPGDIATFDMMYAPILYSFATRHVRKVYCGQNSAGS